MLKTLQAKRSAAEDGFTLIELLIVIVILGVLAAIVVFSVGGITNNSTVSACKADVKTIDTAAEAYLAQKSTAALSLGDIVSNHFLHGDASITANGNTKQGTGYLVTFTPGSATTGAGDATSPTCP